MATSPIARYSTDGSAKVPRFPLRLAEGDVRQYVDVAVQLVGFPSGSQLIEVDLSIKDPAGSVILAKAVDLTNDTLQGQVIATGATTALGTGRVLLSATESRTVATAVRAALASSTGTPVTYDVQAWVQLPATTAFPSGEVVARTAAVGVVLVTDEVTAATALKGSAPTPPAPVATPATLAVSPANLSVSNTGTAQFTASVRDASNQPVSGVNLTVSSASPANATVPATVTTAANGDVAILVTGHGAGGTTAAITVAVQGYPAIPSVTRTVTVTAPAPTIPTDPDLAMVYNFNNAGPAQFRHLRVFDKLVTLTNGKVSRWGNILDDTTAKAMVTRPGFTDGAPKDGTGYITGEGLYCPSGAGLGSVGATGATWGVVSKYVSSGDASENGTILSVGIYGAGSAYGGMRLVRSSNADSLGLSPTDSATQVFVASGVKMSDFGFHTHYMHLNAARDLLLVHTDRDLRDQFTNDGGYIAALLPNADYDVYLAPFRTGTYQFSGKIAAEFSVTGRPNAAQNKVLNDWSRTRLGQVDATEPLVYARGNSIIRGAANGASGRLDAWVPSAYPTALVVNRGYSGAGFGGPKNGINDYLDDDGPFGGRSAFNYMEDEMDFSARSRVVWLGWEGTNDRLGAGQAEIDRYLAWFDHVRALKTRYPALRVAGGTWLPFGAGAVNTTVPEYTRSRSVWSGLPAHTDVQFDPATHPVMGYASGNVTNSTYYDPDFVHPTATGQTALVGMYQTAIAAGISMA